jgi:hypothetical protein
MTMSRTYGYVGAAHALGRRAAVDASAGFADNDALATELLGFRPTRHAPLGTASTLRFTPADADDPDDDPDDEPG